MSTSSPARATVLLVEDNEAIRGAFSILLEESGYVVLQASTGQDAVRISAEQGPDLVLLDLGLPDMDGLEVARRLKADGRTRAVPVVALTGRAMDADVEACRAAGCSGYFLKPIDAAKLLGAISTYLPHPV